MRSKNYVLEKTVEEYQRLLVDVEICARLHAPLDWDMLQNKLQAEAEWTRDGAAHITRLARDYGGFMLRNALALATALGIEDGALGF